MFFLDSTGFYALVVLIIQCALAWVFAAFLAALAARDLIAVGRWRSAFIALAIGLTAVMVRFLMAHRHVADVELVREGAPLTRMLYAIYLGGKCAYLWLLARGFAEMAQRPWPGRRIWTPGVMLTAAIVGAALPTVESVLLAQVPLNAAAFGYVFWSSRPAPVGSKSFGARLAGHIALLWGLVWCGLGLAILEVGPFHPTYGSLANRVLEMNSVFDLILQVALAASLIVVAMHDAQKVTIQALEERDQLRDQVARDERLRALSTLVSGVAHEINNPLTAILGFADDLSSDSKEQRDRAASIVAEQADRCRGIVQRLSLLGSQQTPSLAILDLQQLVQRVARGFEPQLLTAGVTLVVDASRSAFVRGDAIALEQVVTNLLSNALQASPRGSPIRIRVGTEARTTTLLVEDRGPGVPPADRARIFEPFWTTKDPGVGTGLGLAVVHALVAAHRGSITVEDRPGGGARFLVRLPACSPPVAAATVDPAPTGAAGYSQRLRLLIVDDEPVVRLAVIRHARDLGWSTAEAGSAEVALRVLLDDREEFDAVLCDVRMPGISGVGFHDRLAVRAPHLLRRVLFVTGDLTSPEATRFAARCRAPIVTKPLPISQLLTRLQALAQPA